MDFWGDIQNLIIKEVIPYQEKILKDEVAGAEKVMQLKILRLRQVFLMENFMGLFFRIAMFQNGLKVLHIPCQSNLIRSWKQEQIK